MERKLVADRPVTIAGITLVPVIKLLLDCRYIGGSLICSGTKEPFSIVLVSESTKRAFNVCGEEIPLDQLLQQVPAVKEVLENLPSQ